MTHLLLALALAGCTPDSDTDPPSDTDPETTDTSPGGDTAETFDTDDTVDTDDTDDTVDTADTASLGAVEGTLRVLTYNVKGLPDLVSDLDPADVRMPEISPLLNDYDIVGVQEDFVADNHTLLVADATHPLRHAFTDQTFGTVYGSGLTLLAQGVEIAYDEEHYTDCNGIIDDSSDCLAAKGFQVLRVQLGDRELDIYNTHHDAGGSNGDEDARASQVGQVLASMDGRSAGRAILFMGDTNLHAGDSEDDVQLQRYADAGLRDACLEVGCAETDHIDRFLVRDSAGIALTVESWEVEEQFVDGQGQDLSDHPAVAVTIRWEQL